MSDVTITDANFEADVLKANMPVLVDFWAPWCQPCKIVGPIVEELAKEYAGKLKVGKLNVDDNPDAASAYGVMSIPTLIVFKGGQPLKIMVGAQSKENLKKGIEEVLNG
jgi:thioredoxin 1